VDWKNENVALVLVLEEKKTGVTKVSRVLPLGMIHVWTQFHDYPSSRGGFSEQRSPNTGFA